MKTWSNNPIQISPQVQLTTQLGHHIRPYRCGLYKQPNSWIKPLPSYPLLSTQVILHTTANQEEKQLIVNKENTQQH